MRQKASTGMDLMRPIVFLDALLRLQAMIGRRVKVEVNEYGCFFGCGFEGKLERVQSTSGTASGVCVFLEGGAGFYVDPANCEAMLVDGGDVWWLEFHRPLGPAIAVQPVDQDRQEVSDAANV